MAELSASEIDCIADLAAELNNDAAIDWEKRCLRAERRVKALEEENDLLALANKDLRDKAAASTQDPLAEFEALRVHGTCAALAPAPLHTIPRAAGAGNCVACSATPGASGLDVACAGADGVVRVYADAGAAAWAGGGSAAPAHACGSPAICVAWAPPGDRLACGCMDGSLQILDAGLAQCDRRKDHEARVVALAWSRDGALLATCARDKSVVVYRREASGAVAKKHTFVLPTNPESLCFLGATLVVSARDEPFMRHVDLETLAEKRVSLNRNASFACLHLAPSSDDGYLCAATDADKHVVYPAGKNAWARVLVGHQADEYANARVAWLGESVVSNSKDPSLFQWDFGSGKVLTHVERAHANAVRDLAVSGGALVTCSFDKCVRLWGTEA